MESEEKKNNKNIKIIILIISLLVIIGVIVGLVVLKVTQGQNEPDSGEIIDETNSIISDYQKRIDEAEDNETKALLYTQRAYDLREVMYTSGRNECEQIKEDIKNAKELTEDEKMIEIANSMLSACVSSEDSELQTITIENAVENE